MEEQVGQPGRERSSRRVIKGVLGGGVGVSMTGAPTQAAQRSGPIWSFDYVAVLMRNTAATVSFYCALGFTVNESPQVCLVHFGDQKINFY